MLPPAPGLFSTTTVWPQALRNSSAMRRATKSVEPPGEKPTTIVICLLGQSACACAKVAAARTSTGGQELSSAGFS